MEKKIVLVVCVLVSFWVSGSQSSCPYGWTDRPETNYCYLATISNTSRTWLMANEYCQSIGKGSQLLWIQDNEEKSWLFGNLYQYLAESGDHQWWIGLVDLGGDWPSDADGRLNWVSGDVYNHTVMSSPLIPRSSSNETRCGFIWSQIFDFGNCSETRQFICKRPKNVTSRCDEGWERYSGTCYKYIEQPANYTDARSTCRHMSGDLPKVDDLSTQTSLLDLSVTRQEDLWLGLTVQQQGNVSVWFWSNGSQTTEVTDRYWNQEKSSSFNESSCAIIESSPGNPSRPWVVSPCSSTHSYYCQKPAVEIGPICEPSWVWGTGTVYCYRFSEVARNWRDAFEDCKEMGSDLMSIQTEAEQNWFERYLYHVIFHYGLFWGGFNNLTSPQWEWTDGSDTWYIKEAQSTQYEFAGDGQCGAFSSHYPTQLQALQCVLKNKYLCKKAANTANIPRPTPTVIIPVTSSPQWVWFARTKTFYLFSPYTRKSRLSWLSAEDKCKSLGGHLLSITTPTEYDFIKGYFTQNELFSAWMGLNDLQTDGLWEWSDGTPLSFFPWGRDEPSNNNEGKDCVGYSAFHNGLVAHKCVYNEGFICKKSFELKPLNPTSTPRRTTLPSIPGLMYGCSYGWVRYRDFCYLVIDQQLPWRVARDECRDADESDLVNVGDDEENRFVNSLIPDSGNEKTAWLGLTDRDYRSYFQWTNGEDITYVNWAPYQTRYLNPDKQSCVAMNDTGSWLIKSCSSLSSSTICKRSVRYMRVEETSSCPQNGVLYRNKCFTFYTNITRTWNQSQQTCQKSGGHLASITDRKMQTFLSLVFPENVNDSWIGLSLQAPAGMTWANGELLDFTNWASQKEQENGECVSMDNNGLWNKQNCSYTKPFICESPILLTTTTTATTTTMSWNPSTGCPNPWAKIGNGCIRTFNLPPSQRVSWPEAREECLTLGGDLISIHDKAAELSLNSTLQNKGGQHFWIGATKVQNTTSFKWSDDSPFDYSNWAYRIHPTANTISCGQLSSRDLKWQPADCGETSNYICQIASRLSSVSTTKVTDGVVSTVPVTSQRTTFSTETPIITTPVTEPLISGGISPSSSGLPLHTIVAIVSVSVVVFFVIVAFAFYSFRLRADTMDRMQGGFDNPIHFSDYKNDKSVSVIRVNGSAPNMVYRHRTSSASVNPDLRPNGARSSSMEMNSLPTNSTNVAAPSSVEPSSQQPYTISQSNNAHWSHDTPSAPSGSCLGNSNISCTGDDILAKYRPKNSPPAAYNYVEINENFECKVVTGDNKLEKY